MPRQHSEETKKKIADGLKKHYLQKRRNAAGPTRRRRMELFDKFVEGHPEGLEPNAVRNFGDLGPEVNPIQPKTAAQLAKEQLQRRKNKNKEGKR